MSFKQATRDGLYLRCAIFGPSGSGKTLTAMKMAKGMASKTGGKFALIDTESRSASKYADRISFDVDDLNDKTIDSYIRSMTEGAKAGYKVLVIDSLSHAWRELTEEVDRITQSSSSKNSFNAWGKVSPKQKKLVEAILNFPGHIIATMRSKTEWVIAEGRNGRMMPEKMGLAPEQGKGIEYEFDMLLEMNQAHQGTVTKDRTGKFQDAVIDKPGEDFGIALHNWLTSPGNKEPIQQAVQTPKKPTAMELRKEGNEIIRKIGEIMTFQENGIPLFNEDEKAQTRNIIGGTKLNQIGIEELSELLKLLEEQKMARLEKAA